MERIGKIIAKSAAWMAALMFLVVAPMVAYSHAGKQQQAARDKWGTQLDGTVVKTKGPIIGDELNRETYIKFAGHNGEPVTVMRIMYYKHRVGDKIPVWQSKSGAAFVKYDYEESSNWAGWYKGHRISPWPTTQGTYFWRFVFIGLGGALAALLIYHIGCWIEEVAHKKRREKLIVAEAA